MYPASEDLLPIAQVLKSYGTDGEVVIGFTPLMPEDINLEEPVFLIFEGLPVPFFIESFTLRGTLRAVIRIEDVESMEEAEEMVGMKLYYPADTFEDDNSTDNIRSSANIEDFPPEKLVGYTLFDQNGNTIGAISLIYNFSGNICLGISTSDTLYPFHPELVIKFDKKHKKIVLSLPEGL